MPMPRRGHVKIFFYAPPEFREELRRESKARKMTLGKVIQDAMNSRVRLIRK